MALNSNTLFLIFFFSVACFGESHAHQSKHSYEIRAVQPEHNMTMLSPDKKYVASIIFDSGTVAVLSVYQYSQKGTHSKQLVSGPIDDVRSFLWLPNHSHTLIYATSGISGSAIIGQFRGNHHDTVLLAAKHPHGDVYTLYGASSIGKKIVYGYSENYVPQYSRSQARSAEQRLRLHRSLELPKD